MVILGSHKSCVKSNFCGAHVGRPVECRAARYYLVTLIMQKLAVEDVEWPVYLVEHWHMGNRALYRYRRMYVLVTSLARAGRAYIL